MSSKTKIVVLHMKEIIYTIIIKYTHLEFTLRLLN